MDRVTGPLVLALKASSTQSRGFVAIPDNDPPYKAVLAACATPLGKNSIAESFPTFSQLEG